MRIYLLLSFVAAVGFNGSQVLAQAPSTDELIQEWQNMPEDLAMREVCASELRYATEIATREAHGASLAMLLRWAEQESERSAADLPSLPIYPIGTELMLTKLIQQSYVSRFIYQKIAGGFPQWAYRSCLKGHSIDK